MLACWGTLYISFMFWMDSLSCLGFCFICFICKHGSFGMLWYKRKLVEIGNFAAGLESYWISYHYQCVFLFSFGFVFKNFEPNGQDSGVHVRSFVWWGDGKCRWVCYLNWDVDKMMGQRMLKRKSLVQILFVFLVSFSWDKYCQIC